MGLCAVSGCNNRFCRGMKLFRFPTDPRRRREWAAKVNRDGWYPSNNSRICQIHFTQDQFESHRQDGLRKLKPNAIPTLLLWLQPPPYCRKPAKKSAKKPATKSTKQPVKNCQPVFFVKNTALEDHSYHKIRCPGHEGTEEPHREETQSFVGSQVECRTQSTVPSLKPVGKEEAALSHYTDFTYVGDEVVVFTTYVYREDQEAADELEELLQTVSANQISAQDAEDELKELLLQTVSDNQKSSQEAEDELEELLLQTVSDNKKSAQEAEEELEDLLLQAIHDNKESAQGVEDEVEELLLQQDIDNQKSAMSPSSIQSNDWSKETIRKALRVG